jgi:hypothetical protein
MFKLNIKNKNTIGYLVNFFFSFAVLFSIGLMFFVQFKVEYIKAKVARAESNIALLEDEIRVLKIEWVYLTRPERLRSLSAKYLKENIHITANQVKDTIKLKEYYIANLKKRKSRVAFEQSSRR